MSLGLLKKHCTECNKEFYPPSTDWVYKTTIDHRVYKWQCSWSCYRKATKNIKRIRRFGGERN